MRFSHALPSARRATGWRPRRVSVFAALTAGLLVIAGCANVPKEDRAQAVTADRASQPTSEVPQPAKDIDALTVVRDFVHASARSRGDNAAARVYLDEAARENWRPDKGITILEDTFGTVYGPAEQQSADPNERLVTLRGTNVGKLGPDGAFIPVHSPYELPVRVRRQADGQWRMMDPPSNVVITESDFTATYFRVPVFFFAPDSNALVPDLRYVVAKPQAGLPGRVVDLLLSGPSDGLVGAVRNPLGEQAGTETNVKAMADGALAVPLTGVEERSSGVKQLIATQIVLSLQSVSTNRVRLLSDGSPLVEGHRDWRPSDLPSYEALASPSSELPGLVTVGGRVRSLADGSPVRGPAGSGAYEVVSAAQSIDGARLAIVESAERGVRLRVGDYGAAQQTVDLSGGTMTRPTWRPARSDSGESGEVWTVVDNAQVVRVLRMPNGKWAPQAVNATEVSAVGPISQLRLSRDGVRAAVVAGGQLVIASVVRDADSVTLRAPRVLQGGALRDVVDVDWASQDTVVAATSSASLPVARLPLDGLRMDAFNSSNLTAPVHQITAAPSRSTVVADAGGLWTASNVGEVWRPHPASQSASADPFYPG